MSLIIPFNHNPSANSYSTNYTPASGKYARITPKHLGTSDLVIGGNTVWTRTKFFQAFPVSVGGSTVRVTLPSDGLWKCQVLKNLGDPTGLITGLWLVDPNNRWQIDLTDPVNYLQITAPDPMGAPVDNAAGYGSLIFDAMGGVDVAIRVNNNGYNFNLTAYRVDTGGVPEFWVRAGTNVAGEFYYEEYSVL